MLMKLADDLNVSRDTYRAAHAAVRVLCRLSCRSHGDPTSLESNLVETLLLRASVELRAQKPCEALHRCTHASLMPASETAALYCIKVVTTSCDRHMYRGSCLTLRIAGDVVCNRCR